LGKFPDMLKASAHSASMLAYLDQTQSRNTAPNQNYAREIMELHTLGVDGGYTQTDVAELSRVLTGWTIQGRGNFTFNANIHDWNAKMVLGVTIPAGAPSQGQAGINEGEQMLDVLVNHPNTARYIATKMLMWPHANSERDADRGDRVRLQGDGRRHQVDGPRDPQRLVAAGRADEVEAGVSLSRRVAALDQPDYHVAGGDQRAAQQSRSIPVRLGHARRLSRQGRVLGG